MHVAQFDTSSAATRPPQPASTSTPSGRSRADVSFDRRTRTRPRDRAVTNNGSSAARLAKGLGWVSIALGVTELIAPGAVQRIAGSRQRNRALVRLYGIREIAAGMLILSRPRNPVTGVWSRVAGDALDLLALAGAASRPTASRTQVAVAAAGVLGVTALDVMCARQLQQQANGSRGGGAARLVKTIAINRGPEELYSFWHDFENLPQFMYHLRSVRVTGPRTSHWVANAPAGGYVEWDAQIIDDIPNRRIAWRSMAGADIAHSGSVEFERRPGARGTMVRVELEYTPPVGPASIAIAKLFNEAPDQQIEDDLRRFKQLIETGDVIRSDGSPDGVGRIKQQPARPAGGNGGPRRSGLRAARTFD